MRILHLLSNWKWTERAEPAADLALAQSRLGQDVVFACDRAPRGSEGVADHAKRKGLPRVVSTALPKHLRPLTTMRDAARLRELVHDFEPDVVHCHMPNAHLLAALATRGAGGPPLVRSVYEPELNETSFRDRLLMRRCMHGLVVLSDSARQEATRLGLRPESIEVAVPGVDLERFSPERELEHGRGRFGLGESDFVVGVVSRIRASRRLDIPLYAMSELAPVHAQLRLLIVGRGGGSAVGEVVTEPSRELGIADRIVLAGYCGGDDLVAAYRAMDVLVYPMPGTDKSCRTVREAMASGVPVIAPSIGFLPQLVTDGRDGRLIDLSADGLCGALRELVGDPEAVRRMSVNARETARTRFDPSAQAKRTLELYARLVACAGRVSGRGRRST